MITATAVIVHDQYVGTIRRSGDFTVMRFRPDLEQYLEPWERGEQCFAFKCLAVGMLKTLAAKAIKRSWGSPWASTR